MSDTENPQNADANEVSSRLIAGLKSCRSVVENYKAMLSGGETDESADREAGDSKTTPKSS